MYNAVGIDVSKGKSTVAVLQPGGTIVRKPFDVIHSSCELKSLTDYILSLDGETKAVMECTGRYHEPILRALSGAGIFVSAVNPHLIKNFGNNTIRKVKSDPADSKKIARYTLDNWADLREYSSMETTRAQLKTLNAQMAFFTKQKVAAKTNLISLLDMTYPGVNDLFDAPTRDDGTVSGRSASKPLQSAIRHSARGMGTTFRKASLKNFSMHLRSLSLYSRKSRNTRT